MLEEQKSVQNSFPPPAKYSHREDKRVEITWQMNMSERPLCPKIEEKK